MCKSPCQQLSTCHLTLAQQGSRRFCHLSTLTLPAKGTARLPQPRPGSPRSLPASKTPSVTSCRPPQGLLLDPGAPRTPSSQRPEPPLQAKCPRAEEPLSRLGTDPLPRGSREVLMKRGASGGGPPDTKTVPLCSPGARSHRSHRALFPLYPEPSQRPMGLSGGVRTSLSTPLPH